MNLTISPTDQIIEHCGCRCRIWRGESDTGVFVLVAIAFVCASKREDITSFDEVLKKIEVTACVNLLPDPPAR